MIEVESKNIDQLAKILKDIPEKTQKKIIDATNDAALKMKDESEKAASGTYLLGQDDLKKTMSISPAIEGKLSASVISKGNANPLLKFKVSPSNPGERVDILKAQVKRASSLKGIKGAFVQVMKSGHVGVFKRDGAKSLPISQLYSVSVPTMLASKELSEIILNNSRNVFVKDLDKAIDEAMK